MEIRRARPDDADGWAAVIVAVAAERTLIGTEPPVDAAARAERTRASLAGGVDWLWVVEDGGRIVGQLILWASARDVRTLGMALVAEARGQGVGARLLRAALEFADAQGVPKVDLEVWPENGRAVALYATQGFVVEGLRREHWLRADGTRRDSLIMGRLAGRGRGTRGPDGGRC